MAKKTTFNARSRSLLYEMMKDSKRSDRTLSKIIGVSQPTITRMRQKLEKTGYILEYTIIPNLEKIGFEIASITYLSIFREKEHGLGKNVEKWIESNPKIVFAANGNGLNGKDAVIVSLHKDFTEYSEFMLEFRAKLAANIKDIESFLVPLRGKILKHFGFRHLENTE